MSLEILDQNLESGAESSVETLVPLLDDTATKQAPKVFIDARRRLEDKLDEMRLKRELREYQFDTFG